MTTLHHVIQLDSGFQLGIVEGGLYGIFRDGELFGRTLKGSLEKYQDHVAATTGYGIIKAKLLVTGACNQRCYYCSVATDWDKKGLTLAQVKLVIERLSRAGVVLLQLHGGDVAVRRDLTEILAEAERRGVVCDFFTNGSGPVWQTPATFASLAKLRVKPCVTISMLAGSQARHDELAGYKGAFRQALNTVRELQAAGCPVKMTISLTKESAAELAAVAQLATEHGCRLSIISETYSSVGGVIDTGRYSPSPEQVLAARQSVIGDRVVELDQITCSAGIASVTIDHFGNLVGCERNVTRTFGSLLEAELGEIVASEPYRAYMRSFYRRPEVCSSCPEELARYCNWCPAIPFNFDIDQSEWVAFHCRVAMTRRLFWTGRADPVPGSTSAAQNTFEQPAAAAAAPSAASRKVRLPMAS